MTEKNCSVFQDLLAEGLNKDIQSRLLKIDQGDGFSQLIKTAEEATMFVITIKALIEE